MDSNLWRLPSLPYYEPQPLQQRIGFVTSTLSSSPQSGGHTKQLAFTTWDYDYERKIMPVLNEVINQQLAYSKDMTNHSENYKTKGESWANTLQERTK